jgi:hypothetical protein
VDGGHDYLRTVLGAECVDALERRLGSCRQAWSQLEQLSCQYNRWLMTTATRLVEASASWKRVPRGSECLASTARLTKFYIGIATTPRLLLLYLTNN